MYQQDHRFLLSCSFPGERSSYVQLAASSFIPVIQRTIKVTTYHQSFICITIENGIKEISREFDLLHLVVQCINIFTKMHLTSSIAASLPMYLPFFSRITLPINKLILGLNRIIAPWL